MPGRVVRLLVVAGLAAATWPLAGGVTAAPAVASSGGAGGAAAPRRAAAPAADPQGGAGLGRHPQRHPAARLGVARAGGDRAARLRLGRLRHLHPHRFEHRGDGAEAHHRRAGQRRAQPADGRRHLLPRPSRRADRRSAEARPAEVRPRRRQGLRRRAHRDDRIRRLARVRRAARRPLRRPSVERRHRTGGQRGAGLPGHPALSSRASR